MKRRELKDVAASVRQHLLNEARASGRPFNELLQYFAMERFLYRLSKSPHGNRFVLKGTLMLATWEISLTCPTKDIDLLGRGANDIGRIVDAVKETILPDLPAPRIRGYMRESAVAEKFHAMAWRGLLNSRMRDFFDVWALSRRFDFDGTILAAAVRETFARRRLEVAARPVALTGEFAEDAAKAAQWRGFLRKGRLEGAPNGLAEAVEVIAAFLAPGRRGAC